GKRLLHEQRLKGDERVQVGPLIFGVSIVRSLSGGEATPLPSRPSPQETVEEAASILLSMANDQEPPHDRREPLAGDLVESDVATSAQMADEAAEQDAASILLSMAEEQEPPHNGLEPSGDDPDEIDA